MKSARRVILFCVLMLLIGGGAFYILNLLHEPTLGGKTVSQWMYYRVYDGGNSNYFVAQQALQRLGAAAVPTLIGFLNADESRWLDKSVLIARLRGLTVQQARYSAAWACAAIGPPAEPALPALTRMLEQRDCWAEAAIALKKIGPSGIRVLTNALSVSKEEEVRCFIVTLLPTGTDTNASVSALYGALQDPSAKVRSEAAWALGTLHAEPAVTVEKLTACLNDPDRRVQELAMQALALFGTNATPAVPALLEISRTNTIGIASDAWRALLKIDPIAGSQAAQRREITGR